MLLNRRSILAGALLPLVPAATPGDDQLLLLGAQLERRYHVSPEGGAEVEL